MSITKYVRLRLLKIVLNNTSMLYPLKFQPILKEKLWGGQKLQTFLNKNANNSQNIGESWEMSGVKEDESEVSNGFLQGNTLSELVEIYMGDLVGEKVFKQFGHEFPLLIKFIDANDVLSIQVHPDDKLAKERHKAYGKTEMWYIMQADDESSLIAGFDKNTTKEEYTEALRNGQIQSLLKSHPIQEGDSFFIPAGCIHAIGKGALVAEIQQTSDVTYRIFDFNRKDTNGKTRELHTDLAIDAIDFNAANNCKIDYDAKTNRLVELKSCQYFTTNIVEFDRELERDFYDLDSFLIYLCTEGSVTIEYNNGTEELNKGETILIPADLKSISLKTKGKAKLLEVHL